MSFSSLVPFMWQVLSFLIKTHQKRTLYVRLLGHPDPSGTMSGSGEEQEPREWNTFKQNCHSEQLRNSFFFCLFFFAIFQFLSDSDPSSEGEHRYWSAGAASGCEKRRTGGKHKDAIVQSFEVKPEAGPLKIRFCLRSFQLGERQRCSSDTFQTFRGTWYQNKTSTSCKLWSI